MKSGVDAKPLSTEFGLLNVKLNPNKETHLYLKASIKIDKQTNLLHLSPSRRNASESPSGTTEQQPPSGIIMEVPPVK